MRVTVIKKTMCVAALALGLFCIGLYPRPAVAALSSAGGIDDDADAALKKLYADSPAARMLAEKAKAVLVFPNIVKGGFLVTAQYGEGVLLKENKAVGYYNTVAGSYGFQAGVQSFAYVLFLMTDSAIDYLDKSAGWELGVGPSLVVVNKGMAKSLTSTTLKDDVYAFIFSQKGLMGGVGVQGSKITKINPRS
jgi:lipid-binding SYLF domain-containing protein